VDELDTVPGDRPSAMSHLRDSRCTDGTSGSSDRWLRLVASVSRFFLNGGP